MSWFTTLGEKAGRTDIWVIFVALSFLMSISTVLAMSWNFLPYVEYIYNDMLTLLKWILTGAYIDFGIYSWRQVQIMKKNNGTI